MHCTALLHTAPYYTALLYTAISNTKLNLTDYNAVFNINLPQCKHKIFHGFKPQCAKLNSKNIFAALRYTTLNCTNSANFKQSLLKFEWTKFSSVDKCPIFFGLLYFVITNYAINTILMTQFFMQFTALKLRALCSLFCRQREGATKTHQQ